MVLTETGGLVAAGAAGVGAELFGYNRSNFKYDREMRQKNEIGLLNFRIQQAGLWREDVRDIIGMTEKKMDQYLVVAILELGMCVGFFSKGRLEPGVPPWLVTLYLLSLVGSFLYLLMSVLFAMHAAVVANCTAVRLATQFVRLPIPSWEQVEETRTYVSAFETLPLSKMLRVPFLGRRSRLPPLSENEASCSSREHGIPDGPSATADPWGLERPGHERNLSELQPMNPALRMHVELAHRASLQYQCFDAFARVSMSFGTTQLMHTIMYYVIGTIAWQNGAVWPAVCIALLMTGVHWSSIRGDCALSFWQRLQACAILLVGKPLAAFIVAYHVMNRGQKDTWDLSVFFPIVCLSQAAWLFWMMKLLQICKLDNGIVLPTRFRTVLYLDVFGWLHNKRHSNLDPKEHLSQTEAECLESGKTAMHTQPPSMPSPGCGSSISTGLSPTSMARADSGIETILEAPEPEPEDTRLEPAQSHVMSCNCMPSQAGGRDREDTNSEMPLSMLGVLLEDAPVGDRHWELQDGLGVADLLSLPKAASVNGSRVTPSLRKAPRDVFDPHSFTPGRTDAEIFGAAAAAAEVARLHPGHWPARTFHSATLLMVFFWSLGVLFPLPGFKEFLTKPHVEEILLAVQEKYHRRHGGRRSAGYIGTDPNGNPLFIPIAPKVPHVLDNGERLNVKFPTNAGFFPRGLSMDEEGQQLLVAGDVGIYVAMGNAPIISDSSDFGFSANRRLSDDNKFASEEALTFNEVQPCPGLEGQALRDASMVCVGHNDRKTCRVFVLVFNGPQILECFVKKPHEYGQEKDSDAPVNVAWTISRKWLYDNHVEQVNSLAIDNTCLQRHEHGRSGRKNFLDKQDAGCIVIGTGATSHRSSYGRIVQLREKYTDRWTLVPERSIHVRNSQVNPGALHVMDSGYVLALRSQHDEKNRNTILTNIEVFSKYSGRMMHVFALPDNLNWLTLSGNATHLLAIGLRQDPWRFELWRFPVPKQLLRHP